MGGALAAYMALQVSRRKGWASTKRTEVVFHPCIGTLSDDLFGQAGAL